MSMVVDSILYYSIASLPYAILIISIVTKIIAILGFAGTDQLTSYNIIPSRNLTSFYDGKAAKLQPYKRTENLITPSKYCMRYPFLK